MDLGPWLQREALRMGFIVLTSLGLITHLILREFHGGLKVPSLGVSAPSRLGKRLGLPPPLRLSHTDSSDPSHVGTSNAAHASSTDHGVVREDLVSIGSSGKAGVDVIH
ncbi:hypothetical protein Tco_1335792 [Tanacetum coccineum]